jgi:hypothetical protein
MYPGGVCKMFIIPAMVIATVVGLVELTQNKDTH